MNSATPFPKEALRKKILAVLEHPCLDLELERDPGSAVDLIQEYLEEWRKWSVRIDLTSESSCADIVERHFFDSLQYARALRPVESTLDIGSGAGFPGFPLQIVWPSLAMSLLESRKKRVAFLRSVVRRLGLSGTRVIHSRAEDLAGREPEGFFQVLFKAVGELSLCQELARPLLQPGGRMIIKKEPGALADPNSGFRIFDEIPIQNISGTPSKLIVFEKI